MSKVKVSYQPAPKVGQCSKAFLSRNRRVLFASFLESRCQITSAQPKVEIYPGTDPYPVTVTSVTHSLCHGLDRPLDPVPIVDMDLPS